MNIIKQKMYDRTAESFVIGSLLNNPLLLSDDRYHLLESDFSDVGQQAIFYAIKRLAETGSTEITPQAVDLYLKQYEIRYTAYQNIRGLSFVTGCCDIVKKSDVKQFDLYYERLKKFSVLRALNATGINTDNFYNPNKDILNSDIEDIKLNNTSIDEMLNSIRSNLVKIENNALGKSQAVAKTAGDGLQELLADLRAHPEIGLPLDGQLVNWSVRGARLGKLYIYSAPSGAGKTRNMVGNACAISMPYIDEQGQVVERADYRKILFVATEMQIDEIQTLILAHVSGVNEEHILYSRFTPEEETRIIQASKIIDMYKDNFLIECIPDPSIAMIKTRLIKYIVQDQIQYIFYDYIFSSPGLLTEFRDVAVREDVALMMLSNTLKEIAMQYNVFIQSATQLNENWSKREIGLRDQNCLRGSKAIADKVDIGMIGVRLNPEEYKQIDAIWVEIARKNHYDVNKRPNIVIDIYKNRRGKITCKKIFRYFDFGTCRCQDLFMTDDTYKVEQEIGEINFEVRKRGVLDFLAEEAGNNAN